MKGYKAKFAKEKGTWGKAQRTPTANLYAVFPSGSTRDPLDSSSNDLRQHVKCGLPGKLIRVSVPKAFIGSWSRTNPLTSMYPDSLKRSALNKPHGLYSIV